MATGTIVTIGTDTFYLDVRANAARLRRRIRSIVRRGGGFVELTSVNGRVSSVFVSVASHIKFERVSPANERQEYEASGHDTSDSFDW